MIELLNIDCMEYMSKCTDNFFDLAIVDIPYSIEYKISKGGGSHTKSSVKFHQLYSENGKQWDKAVTPNYFYELQRVSKNQIIFGANYYNMPACRGFIIWDKPEMRIPTMSDCEYAWTSFDKPAKMFRVSRKSRGKSIHPTQKPVDLYKNLLNSYAQIGDRILDTHGGSMNIALACYDYKFDLICCEIDKQYYDLAVKYYNYYTKQTVLF